LDRTRPGIVALFCVAGAAGVTTSGASVTATAAVNTPAFGTDGTAVAGPGTSGQHEQQRNANDGDRS
jgi:hypothetical protein